MGEALRARAARVPDWAWLTCVVVASCALRAWLVRGMPAPFVFVDELIYAELGRSVADSASFAVRGVPTSGYSILYPILLAPAYRLFDVLPSAYGAREGDQRDRDVARGGTGLADHPPGAGTRAVDPGRRARRRAAVHGVHRRRSSRRTSSTRSPCSSPGRSSACWSGRRGGGSPRSSVALVAAVATRSQALGFVGAIVLAPFVLALLRRDARVLRRFAPLLGGVAGVVAGRGRRAARARARALRPPRRLQGGRRGRLRRRRRAPLLALARRGADALRRGGARRRPRRAARGSATGSRRRCRSTSPRRSRWSPRPRWSSRPSPRGSRPTACRTATCSS